MFRRTALLPAVLGLLLVTGCASEESGQRVQVAIASVDPGQQVVELRNDTDTAQDLIGWYLSLGREATCQFDVALSLQPGETLHVWALAMDADQPGYNCGLSRPFWSGKEPERIFLYNADGQLIDSFFGGQP